MLRNPCLYSVVLSLGLSGCSAVLEEPSIGETGSGDTQETIEISIEPLSSQVVKTLNVSEFPIQVLLNDSGREHVENVQKVSAVVPLPSTTPISYKIGVGDQITLVRFITQSGFTDDTARETVVQQDARVISDGSILFMETGSLKAVGLTLAELRESLSSALIRNGIDPRFQLEVTGFNSQTITLITNTPANAQGDKVTVSVAENTKGTGLYPVTEKPITLRQLLVQAGLKMSQETLQVVSIQRDQRQYTMPVNHIFAPTTSEYYLTGGDVIKFNEYKYKNFNAYALGGGSTPTQITLSPSKPIHLSDLLFAENGILASPASRKGHIYLLRGQGPKKAYHLDVTNPARLGLATQLMLKPNDIVFASTKPIYDGNTLLSLLNPFNALLNGTAN